MPANIIMDTLIQNFFFAADQKWYSSISSIIKCYVLLIAFPPKACQTRQAIGIQVKALPVPSCLYFGRV